MYDRRMRPLALFLLVPLLLAACSPGGAAQPTTSSGAAPVATARPATAAAGPPASPSAPIALRYGLSVPSVNTLVIYVAEARGMFREQGLEVEVLTTGPASQTIQAMVSSSVDIAGAATDSLINAVEKGADLVMIAGELNRAVYSLVGGRDIRDYADLRGKTLAVSDLRDGSTTLLRRMLLRAGLGPDDVNLVPLGGTPNRAAALTSGQVAGTMLSQPADFRLMAEGYPRLGLSTEAVRDYWFQGQATRRSWLRDNGDTAVRFLRAVVAGDRYIYDPANRDSVIAILAEGTRSTTEEASQTYDLIVSREQALSKEGEIPLEGLRNVLAILGESGVLEGPLPAPEKFYDLSYLERAMR